MNFMILQDDRLAPRTFFGHPHQGIRSVWRGGLFKSIVVSCQAIVQILGLANVKFVKSFGIQDVDKIIQGKLSLCPREDSNADEAQLISIPTWHGHRRDFHFSGTFR